MRVGKWVVGLASLVAGAAVGCGAEAGDASSEESTGIDEVGEVTQEVRSGSHAFAHVLANGTAWVNDHVGTSAGGAIFLSKTATGLYKVILTGLSGGGPDGNVQVVAAGGNSHRCKAESWFLHSVTNNVEIKVRCVNAAGSLTDSEYMFQYSAAGSTTGRGTGAYLRITGHNDDFPLVANSWNSTGGANFVSRPETGVYTVSLPGLALNGGTVQVTATGMTTSHCKAITWGPGPFLDQLVEVRCYSSTTGNTPINSPFSLNYIAGPSSVGIKTRGAFALINANGSTSATFTANTTTLNANCVGATTVVKQALTGTYAYRPASMLRTGGIPHVTTAEDNGSYCKVSGITLAPDGFVNVGTACYNSAGTRRDTKHMVTYAHTQNPSNCL